MKICQVEITVHISPIKQLLATYIIIYLFILLQKHLNAVKFMQCVTHCNGGKRACKKTIIIPCTMNVNARQVNIYIWEAVVYVPITWILCWTELGFRLLRVRWPVIIDCMLWWNMGSGPVGLSKPPSREFHLKYLSNSYKINK